MADESPKRLVPWPCASCGRPSVAQVGLEGGIYVHVCLDHYHVHEEQRMRKIQMYRQLAEDAEDQMADVFGLPRKQRPVQIPAPKVNVNQVNVSGDNLGIINTGTANNIANNLTIIHGQDANFADHSRI